jgi:hypothetical protein
MFLSLGLAAGSAATLVDPFHTSQNNCNYSSVAPYSACDVIGNEMNYDIQSASVSISGGTATVSILFNTGAVTGSGNSLGLGSFRDVNENLMVGDLFFYDPSDPHSTVRYGVAVEDHGSFTSGDLYDISGTVATETAAQALNFVDDYYRRNQTVLMTGHGNPVSTGTVSISNYGNGTSGALYDMVVTFATTSGFMNLLVNNQIGLLFSSADCGNDVIQGTVGVGTGVPEPSPAVLIGVGLMLIAGVYGWRKRVLR